MYDQCECFRLTCVLGFRFVVSAVKALRSMVSDTFSDGLLAEHGVMGDGALFLDTLEVRRFALCKHHKRASQSPSIASTNLAGVLHWVA